LAYSTYLGGSNPDGGAAIAVDASGDAYVTGYTYSTDFPTSGAYQSSGGVEYDEDEYIFVADAFVTRLSSTGSALAYSTYLGGSNYDVGTAIAVDGNGNTYVTGWTYSSDFPTWGAYQLY